MKEVDYIIVGLGLAGVCFAEQLQHNNKSFVVISDSSQQSSKVAGGLYNPVVLKRYTPIWKTAESMALAMSFYNDLEQRFQIKLNKKIPVLRVLHSVEEQNDWFTASDKPILSTYMATGLIKNKNPNINAIYGFGEVNQTGRVDVNLLLETYIKHLQELQIVIASTFNYADLKITDIGVSYQNIKAKYIVFAEGFGITNNPYFNSLPLVPAKGELLYINAPQLNIDFVLKAGVFIIPLDQDNYLVGATYNWKDLSQNITEAAKVELTQKLDAIITCNYTITHQVVGIRPTVKDRRPLVGNHSTYKNIYVLNGLGTRGVLIGPYAAKQLYQFIEHQIPLDKEIDISRFK